MKRISICRLSWVPAALALVLALPGVASAFCRHGRTHCWSCASYTTYTSTPVGVVPTARPAVGGNNGGAVTPPEGVEPPTPPPSAAPVLAFPGARQSFAPAPAFAPTATTQRAAFGAPASQGAYYPAGYYYAAPTTANDRAFAPGSQEDGTAAQGSFLAGYSSAAPLSRIRPGTRLHNGQLFGSHIFQVLQQFGAGLDGEQLLDLGIKAFMDASGVTPTNFERQIIEQIVVRFLRARGDRGTSPTNTNTNMGTNTNTATVTADGTNVIQFLVTVEIRPVAGGTLGRATVTPQTPAPGGDLPPPPPNVPAPTPPPAEAPRATTPPVPAAGEPKKDETTPATPAPATTAPATPDERR